MSTQLTIIQPDDFHVHLRDDEALAVTVPASAAHFARALVMPNVKPPIVTHEQAAAYHQRIVAHVPANTDFKPLMSLYLTQETRASDIEMAAKQDIVFAVKYYPAGATTHSQWGVSSIEQAFHTLALMEKWNLPLLIHGEVVDHDIDIFDREAIFIERELTKIMRHFPGLRIVLEHITTQDAVDFVIASPNTLAATITVHHLLYNRNDLLVGGVKPHYYCLPILKREQHRQALIKAAISGNPKFFLGTDSAPHAKKTKEAACGCAGIFSAPYALPLYASVFEQENALDKLEAFASHHGADFYQLPRNTQKITLTQQEQIIPLSLSYLADTLIPIAAGETLGWQSLPIASHLL